jgi:hypothetical protein
MNIACPVLRMVRSAHCTGVRILAKITEFPADSREKVKDQILVGAEEMVLD